MASSLEKFFIHYSHFVTGSVLSLMLGLFSFPILTRILSREDYGMLGLVSTTMLLIVAIAKAGLSDGIIRFYKDYNDVPERLAVFSSTVVVRGLIFSGFIAVLYITLLYSTSGWFLQIGSKYLACFMIMSAYILLRPLNIIVLNMLRITDRTIFYNVTNLVGKTLSISFSLILLIYLIGELYGFFIGLILSELVVSIILFYWFFSKYTVSFSLVSGKLAMKLIRFGIPLLITELSYLLLTYADRYMIAAFKGNDSLGLYSVGYNLASYVSDLMMFPLSYAVIPIYVGIYKKEGKEKTEEFLNQCLYYLVIAVIPVCVGYMIISKDLFVTLASEKYLSAASFSPIILFGSLLLGANAILSAGLYMQKKSMVILLIMVAALVLNILLNLLLLPTYGVFGAAIATLAACLLSTTLTIILSFRYIRIKIDLRAIFFYSMISGFMYLMLSQITTAHSWTNLVAKIGAGMLIILPVVLFREKAIYERVRAWVPFLKKLRG